MVMNHGFFITTYWPLSRCSHLVLFSIQLHVTKPRLEGKIVWPPCMTMKISTVTLIACTGYWTKMAAAWWRSITVLQLEKPVKKLVNTMMLYITQLPQIYLEVKHRKNVEPNHHLCTMSKHVVLADGKMANISLDVHRDDTYIHCSKSQKISFSILTWLHFPLLRCVLCHHFKENLWYLSYLDRKMVVVFYILS